MPTNVLFERLSSRPPFSRRRLTEIGDQMLRVLRLQNAELSLLITGDELIHELNRRYRRKNKPTDVLAFPMDESRPQRRGPRLLGDVVISLDTAKRQAKAGQRRLLAEVVHLLAHGLLHLVGHDHANKTERQAMEAETERLVQAVLGRRV